MEEEDLLGVVLVEDGSGYINGVKQITYKGTIYNSNTQNNIQNGNGKAKITFISE